MPPTPQQARFEELASTDGYQAVQAVPLPDGTLIITATDDAGDVLLLEALDGNGQRLHELDPLGLIRRLGVVRENALRQAAQMTDAIVTALAIRHADGEELNLTELARESGLARQTLYTRLEAAAIASKRKRKAAA